jgi:glutaminyl-peptide cyclotransferase
MTRMQRSARSLLCIGLLWIGGCTTPPAADVAAQAAAAAPTAAPTAQATAAPTATPTAQATAAADAPAPVSLNYQLVAEYPHDPAAWTQGLVVADDEHLYEGTGDWENSRLRQVELTSGRVVREVTLPEPSMYGEGIALLGDRIFQLTWQDGLGLVYDRSDFSLINGFRYPAAGSQLPREGWGLTTDGTLLYMSDGTADIYVVDPQQTTDSGQLSVVRQFTVTLNGQPLPRLNELEYIDGAIFANVWYEDVIVRIDPQNGRVTGLLDLSGLLPAELQADADVLNGIAYDQARDLLYVTGKHWPRLYALRLLP